MQDNEASQLKNFQVFFILCTITRQQNIRRYIMNAENRPEGKNINSEENKVNSENEKKMRDEIDKNWDFLEFPLSYIPAIMVTVLFIMCAAAAFAASIISGIGVIAIGLTMWFGDSGENTSFMNMFAEKFAKTERFSHLKNLVVLIGDVVNKNSRLLPSPSHQTDNNGLEMAHSLRYGLRIFAFGTILAVFTTVSVIVPPVVPIVGMLAAAYVFTTFACRTADAVNFANQDKKDLAQGGRFDLTIPSAQELGIDDTKREKLLTILVNKRITTTYELGRCLGQDLDKDSDNIEKASETRKLLEEAMKGISNSDFPEKAISLYKLTKDLEKEATTQNDTKILGDDKKAQPGVSTYPVEKIHETKIASIPQTELTKYTNNITKIQARVRGHNVRNREPKEGVSAGPFKRP